jgi:hypothetical protein
VHKLRLRQAKTDFQSLLHKQHFQWAQFRQERVLVPAPKLASVLGARAMLRGAFENHDL